MLSAAHATKRSDDEARARSDIPGRIDLEARLLGQEVGLHRVPARHPETGRPDVGSASGSNPSALITSSACSV